MSCKHNNAGWHKPDKHCNLIGPPFCALTPFHQAKVNMTASHLTTLAPVDTADYMSAMEFHSWDFDSSLTSAHTDSNCLMSQVMSSLSDKERQAVMRFVTSCSRAPLGGFQHLNPPLTLHKVLQPRQGHSVLIWYHSCHKHHMHGSAEVKLERLTPSLTRKCTSPHMQ